MKKDIDDAAHDAIAILSTADFAGGIWTNKQHLAAGLARDRDVLYVESLGLRRPTLSKTDAARVIRRLINRSGPGRATGGSAGTGRVDVLSPRLVPYHDSHLVRTVNGRILNRSVGRRMAAAKVGTFWSFSPLTYGLERHARHFVYHSVDLLHEIPDVPRQLLLDAEARTLVRADIVIASSTEVERHLVNLGRVDVLLWENVADAELFAGSQAEHRIPRAIFAGNLTPQKIDFSLLEQVVSRGVPLALAGPVGIDGTSDRAIERLLNYENVSYLGSLSLRALAVEVGLSCVGIIPYRLNALTAGIFPMKMYEYLAGGLSVVSTALSSLTNTTITGLKVVTADQFADTVWNEVGSFSLETAEVRSTAALPHSWQERVTQARELLRWPVNSARAPVDRFD